MFFNIVICKFRVKNILKFNLFINSSYFFSQTDSKKKIIIVDEIEY